MTEVTYVCSKHRQHLALDNQVAYASPVEPVIWHNRSLGIKGGTLTVSKIARIEKHQSSPESAPLHILVLDNGDRIDADNVTKTDGSYLEYSPHAHAQS